MADFTKLRALLENESFPLRYTHKFIGKHTPLFLAAVDALEKGFPRARRTGSRESSGGDGVGYIALTFEIDARDPDDIIVVLEATGRLPDLKIIL